MTTWLDFRSPELAEAKAANEALRGILQRGATEKRPANDEHVGVRLPAVPDTPCKSTAARGAFRVSELAHDDAEVLLLSLSPSLLLSPTIYTLQCFVS